MIQKKTYMNSKELQNSAISNRFTIYGDLSEYNNRFESISILEQNYICGLAYYNYGIDSQMLLLNDSSTLLLGFDKRVIGIDCITKNEIFHKESISLFYEFIKTEHCILLIFELDVFAVSFDCQLIWFNNFRDTIENYTVLEGNKISINCSNGDELVLSLKNGDTSN